MLATALSVLLATTANALPISTTHGVRSLAPRDTQAGKPVRLRGVVTFASSAHPNDYFYLQDKTGGVRVEWKADRELKPGDAVEVTGTATTGPFVPRVRAKHVEVEPGTRDRLPPPERFHLTPDEWHYLDSQWVSAEAVVQYVWVPDNDPTRLKVDLARGRGTAVAYLPFPKTEPERKRLFALRGAVVRVRGVWERGPGNSNPSHLLVTDADEFEVLKPALSFDACPLATARELNEQPRTDPIADRLPVRVEGVITLNQNDRHFYIKDGTGIVWVRFRDPVPLIAGQRLVAYGFPRPFGTSNPTTVENATLLPRAPRAGETENLPDPVPATVSEAASGKLEGQVVRFRGEVREVGKVKNWPALTVLADNITFTVVVIDPLRTPIEQGSTVEVTGTVTKQQFHGFSWHTFALIARPVDVTVVADPPQPPVQTVVEPWLTGRRIAYLSVGIFGLALMSGAAVTALRVQVRRAKALAARRTEEKAQLEGQLGRAAKFEAVGRVASGVAHDFNNILTVILGCAQLLDDDGTDPKRTATLADIRRAGRLATALTRLLLAFSRQRQVTLQPLDANALIADAEPLLARLLGTRTVLCVSPAPALPPVMGDTGLLLQILINLAANAGEAMPGGGTFTVAMSVPEPGWVRLTATDTGAGMSAEVRAHLFERGFTTKPAGTGTGLATVHDAVSVLGGRIRCRSELGRGTEFEIDLPAAPVVPMAQPLAPAAQFEPPTTEVRRDDTVTAPAPSRPVAPTVLLVEDDDAVCAFVRHVLEGAGMTVLVATEPADALRALAAHAGPIDLLVTDVVLPELSGPELAARVRAQHPGARVLFTSGHDRDDVFPHAEGEPVAFLHKPFTPPELIEHVTRLLGQPVG